jgi:hypothetical protein
VFIFIRVKANIACDVKVHSTGHSQNTDKETAVHRAAVFYSILQSMANKATPVVLIRASA